MTDPFMDDEDSGTDDDYVFTYGNYLERFFDALTGGPGCERLSLPALQDLNLWHNHNAMGELIILDTECDSVHSTCQ